MGIILPILKGLLGVAFDQALNLAITMGIPWLVDWIYKNPKTPSWLKWLMDKVSITTLLIELVEQLKKIQVSDKPLTEKQVAAREAKRSVRAKAREKSGQVGHAADTKELA